MNEMKQWMILVETLLNERPLSPRFLHQLTADTEENRKHLDDLVRRDLSITGGFPIAWMFGILASCRNLS